MSKNSSSNTEDKPIALVEQLLPDDTGEAIPVAISSEIIRLFSEGLYQSPHKAIEELVTNSFDAGARTVFVLTPRSGEEEPSAQDSLWVIDDGIGMDREGFQLLWRVAESQKMTDEEGVRGRLPIGQFGIGKLAAYVLAWRLTHVSKVDKTFLYTSMDFHRVQGTSLHDEDEERLSVALHEISKKQAQGFLAEVEERDEQAWERLFGSEPAESWTAAALSDFRDLFQKLQEGTLSWVLRTALPLTSDFSVFLNGDEIQSTKSTVPLITEVSVGGAADSAADKLEIRKTANGIQIPGITGEITGRARLFERPLSTGKSTQYGRSHGFFVRVRGRVINLEDELFGLDALNHAAWSRFSMEIDADGLRYHLLSSREGVRGSKPIYLLRRYLHLKFNACRTAYEQWQEGELAGIDIDDLIRDDASSLVVEPLVSAIRRATTGSEGELFYIKTPIALEPDAATQWLTDYESRAKTKPIETIEVYDGNAYEELVSYDTETRALRVNKQHPFASKIQAHAKSEAPLRLMGTSEVLTDALLREFGVDGRTAAELLTARDQVLRALAGDAPPDATELLRKLRIAHEDEGALERAVGRAFEVIGFSYEPRGGREAGTDGLLFARLGRSGKNVDDYKVVYDAKTTDRPRIPASKVDFDSLLDFMKEEAAQYAFVVAKAFEGQDDENGKLHRKLGEHTKKGEKISVFLVEDLRRILKLHYLYGVTLEDIRDLFESAHTAKETARWVENLEADLGREDLRVPLDRLLDGLERAKADTKATPNIHAVRAIDDVLKAFEPEKLIAVLTAIETVVGSRWIEVSKAGEVRLHNSAEKVLEQVQRGREALGIGGSEGM